MNYIFDIGNVLIDFKPKEFLKTIYADQREADKAEEIIFRSREWILLDQGMITEEEALKIFCERNPEHIRLIQNTISQIPKMLTPILETVELLPHIKAMNEKLYFLSNYPKKYSEYIQAKYPFFKLFEGGVFSCDAHVLKPDPQIYISLMEKYGLIPNDCVFIDDTEKNILAAQELGMQTILFKSCKDVEEYIKQNEA